MIRRFDLTYALSNDILIYPTDSKPNIIAFPSSTSVVDGVTKYKSGKHDIIITNHHGTHVDAPFHKDPKGRKITDYPLNKFINQCMMIDLTGTDVLRRREINLNDIRNSNLRPLTDLEALIVYTGFCDLMMQVQRNLFGQEKTGFEATFPYFSQEAAEYIANNFPRLNIIGIDSFAVDKQGSNSEVHRTFFAKDILPLETVVELHQLKPYEDQTFTLHSAPLNIAGGDAAQVRAYATIP